MKTFTFLLGILLLTFSNKSFSQDINESNCQSGDIVFIKNSRMTSTPSNEKNKFNCTGIILFEQGFPMVFYADEPMKKCALSDFIKLSDGKKYIIKRMVDATLITEEAVATMHTYAIAKLGTSYDIKEELNTEAFYNAEFIWKIYKTCLGIYVCEAKELTASNDKNKQYSHSGNSLANKFVSINDIYRSECFE